MRRIALLALLPLLAGGCDNMVQQPRYDDYERARLFPNGMVLQHPPAGTIDRAAAARLAAAQRPAMTLPLIQRGRERFNINCAPCHGFAGDGDGMIVSRGFPQPPSYHIDRLRSAPDGHFYDVISNGYGVMYSYADRVEPRDRWAITAYIRALQRTRRPGAPDAR